MTYALFGTNSPRLNVNCLRLAIINEEKQMNNNSVSMSRTCFRDCPSVDSDMSSGYYSMITPIASPVYSIRRNLYPEFQAAQQNNMAEACATPEPTFEYAGQNLDQMRQWTGNQPNYSLNVGSYSNPMSMSPGNLRELEEQKEMEEMKRLLSRPKRIPTKDYICHICYGKDHVINDCPRADLQDKFTPYQGPKKCYGEYACLKCKRCWTSGNSYANMAQSCIKCQIPVFARKQLPINKAVDRGLLQPKKDGSGYLPVRKSNTASPLAPNWAISQPTTNVWHESNSVGQSSGYGTPSDWGVFRG